MRNFMYLIILLTFNQSCKASRLQAQENDIQYIDVVVEEAFKKGLSDDVADLKKHLELGSNDIIVRLNPKIRNTEAILISISSSTTGKFLPVDGQSFFIESKNNNQLNISGETENALSNGIYHYLEALGFRWYLPGDLWTKVPTISDFIIKDTGVVTPEFINRTYGGTGGWGRYNILDPERTVPSMYENWKRRNRMNATFRDKGHQGQILFNKNRAFFEKNPSYLCNISTSMMGYYNFDNPKMVELYTKHALDQLDYENPFPQIVGVDPSDGSGSKNDCLPTTIPEIKTYSDKFFWMANKVAKKLPSNLPNAYVELYAYSNHANTPSFDLHEKVYPVIIPYAFQKVGSPIQFMNKWAEKMEGRPMGIYDYWNITQWSKSRPDFDFYQVKERMKLWKSYNITSIFLESSDSKFSNGPALWLWATLSWDLSKSTDDLHQAFLTDSFKSAKVPMERMFYRWAKNNQGFLEVKLSLEDIAEAEQLTNDPIVLERLGEVKAYIIYLHYLYELENDRKNVQKQTDFIKYIESVNHLGLIQTESIRSYVGLRRAGNNNTPIAGKAFRNLPTKELKRYETAALSKYPKEYAFSELKVTPNNTSLCSGPKIQAQADYVSGRILYDFSIPKPITFEIELSSTKLPTNFSISKSNSPELIYETVIEPEKGQWNKIQVQLSPGNYTMEYGRHYSFGGIKFPKDILFLSNTKLYDNTFYPELFIYVPAGTKSVFFKDMSPQRTFWIDPNGQKVKPKLVSKNLYKVDIAPGLSDQLWSMQFYHQVWEVFNIPESFSLQCFTIND